MRTPPSSTPSPRPDPGRQRPAGWRTRPRQRRRPPLARPSRAGTPRRAGAPPPPPPPPPGGDPPAVAAVQEQRDPLCPAVGHLPIDEVGRYGGRGQPVRS